MIKMTLYKCGIRGEKLESSNLLSFSSREEAEKHVDASPHVKGVIYFYGIIEENCSSKAYDPTGEHMRNLEERFIKAILG